MAMNSSRGMPGIPTRFCRVISMQTHPSTAVMSGHEARTISLSTSFEMLLQSSASEESHGLSPCAATDSTGPVHTILTRVNSTTSF